MIKKESANQRYIKYRKVCGFFLVAVHQSECISHNNNKIGSARYLIAASVKYTKCGRKILPLNFPMMFCIEF